MPRSCWGGILCRTLIAVPCLLFASGCFAIISEDAYITVGALKWTFGTASVERVLALEDGKLITKSFKSKIDGRELRSSDSTGPWKFVRANVSKLPQGELRLDLSLKQGPLTVTQTYVVYPGSSIIREWATLKNIGTTELSLDDPEFLRADLNVGDPASLRFHWMTGGRDKPDLWKLKTEELPPQQPRRFDSYDPVPAQDPVECYATTEVFDLPGPIDPEILLNGKQVWPASEWQYPLRTVSVPFDVPLDIQKGDRLTFAVRTGWPRGWQSETTSFDPTIRYDDGEIHVASREFSGEQDHNGWHYGTVENGNLVDLAYDPQWLQWRKKDVGPGGFPFVGVSEQHADAHQDAVRIWTAPKSGKIRVSGQVCHTGERVGSGDKGGPRPGSADYAPWTALSYGKNSTHGLFVGWDYLGHWTSSYTSGADGVVRIRLRIAGYHKALAPGESITTPKAFIGLFQGDLDNAGNELLDWQYRYLWEYTREGWFPDIRTVGAWWNGTPWGTADDWSGGTVDLENMLRKPFRTVDFMRYTGTSIYQIDRGWWDRTGDWNGPDFRESIAYLHKNGMGQMILVMPWEAESTSRVAQEHPEWLIPNGTQWFNERTLDFSKPQAVAFAKSELDELVQRWGDFSWRDDDYYMLPVNGDDTPQLGQDQGSRDLRQSFLDRHPRSGYQIDLEGGSVAGYDYVRYGSSLQVSDCMGINTRDYWASLLFPPDKITIPVDWDLDRYDKARWRAHLSAVFATNGDTIDRSALEGVRELIDIYRYILDRGVAGRWVHVYRPMVTGDDPTMYFQRLSRDGRRGLIVLRHTPPAGRVVIRPKGLLPKELYFVSYQESDRSERRSGTSLMDTGITLENMAPGELIYLNLPLHPGSKLDREAPTAPSNIVKRRGENMGHPGIELQWQAATDNNWVSYYEIFRNGIAIDKVARGNFYFDHSAGADLAATYEIWAVDGASNVSPKATARGPSAIASQIVDDALGGEIRFSPQWQHAREEPLVAYDGTITSTNQKGATAELTFEGKRVLWFTKLGPENGKAAVSIDGSTPEIVDTYSADNIWGVAVYRKEFPQLGRHMIRIEALGERNAHPWERLKGTFINVDGIRVEME